MRTVIKAAQEHPTGTASLPHPRTEGLQPFLHDTCTTVHAPSLVLSRPDGDLSEGADGFYHGDRRALSALTVDVPDVPLAPVGHDLWSADRTAFRAILRGVGEHTADPAVSLHRVRTLAPGRLREELEVSNAGLRHVRLRLVLTARTDLARMAEVKAGRPGRPRAAEPCEDGLAWAEEGLRVTLRPAAPASPGDAPAPAPGADPGAGTLSWALDLPPGTTWRAAVVCEVSDSEPEQFPAAGRETLPWSPPVVRSADQRLDHLVRRSADDLAGLLLRDAEEPSDTFLAAGSPWFLTLFGRDALWSARMLLPLGTDLAAGTLRTLARRQGTRSDPETDEQPGKILHEVRREGQTPTGTFALPPVYYGTVDATPLWVVLLHDAWRWGMDPREVEALLPHAEAALDWLATHGDADGDGLLEYIDTTGRGLANQGWKDSGDSIRWRDGRLAEAPIALCEVQAYAYEAARDGAALLRAFGRPGAEHWEEWAERLRARFRESFWVSDARGRYPAVALDAHKRPVDSVTSGFGHLLGTGLLDPEESALLAARLTAPDLDSGFGLRTLSTGSAGFNPFGYHIGSVWPHDTAIAVHGLARAGFPDEAARLAHGLIAASEGFAGRLPELFAGHSAEEATRPLPYPASCRPQSWAAAAPFLLLAATLGLDPDVPGGTLTVSPRGARALAPLDLSGLRVAGGPLAVRLGAGGEVRVEAPDHLTVRLTGGAA
ncbi:glycogen debranching N-terminal domain-containing protein [Streptomyces sp. NPDC002248]